MAPGEIPMFTDGLPRVPLDIGWVVLRPTDWVISSRYTGEAIEVISAEEWAERFGPSGSLKPLQEKGTHDDADIDPALARVFCFVFASIGVPSPRINLTAAGLAFWMLSLLVSRAG